MKDLFFFTDRYPYSNSEAFIENEIDIMASYFDRVYILPCGLMVDTETCRKVPRNVKVLPPPAQDNIWKSKPSRQKKILWGVRHLLPWFLCCLFSKYFYREIAYLVFDIGFTPKRAIRIFRVLGPALRNRRYYKKQLGNMDIGHVTVYSYWIDPTMLFAEDILCDTHVGVKVSRAHRVDLYANESNIGYIPFQKQIIKSLHKLFVISDDGYSYLNRLYPELSGKISVSRLGTKDYGINPARFAKGEFVIASCSFVHKVKRVNLIVDALALLNTQDVIVRWVHFGGGQDLDTIIQYAKKKLTGRVEYDFKGHVANKDIIDYYKNNHVDLFLNVSASEGIPVSIMEAASFSLPVVATDVGGTREIVKNSENGVLLSKGFEVKELSSIIENLLNDSSTLAEMRNSSRRIWENIYFCEVNYHEFYKCLMNL